VATDRFGQGVQRSSLRTSFFISARCSDDDQLARLLSPPRLFSSLLSTRARGPQPGLVRRDSVSSKGRAASLDQNDRRRASTTGRRHAGDRGLRPRSKEVAVRDQRMTVFGRSPREALLHGIPYYFSGVPDLLPPVAPALFHTCSIPIEPKRAASIPIGPKTGRFERRSAAGLG
jgi:hypothetical protein